jgi:hypothetical protein
MDELVNNKIDFQCNDPESKINGLFKTLETSFDKLTWENISYLHFPSYLIDCLISEEDVIGINHQHKLQVTISLLCEFYTIFVYDQYGFRGKSQTLPFQAVYTLYSFEQSKEILPAGLLATIEKELQKVFPAKKFIGHYGIMKRMVISANPYGKDSSLYPTDEAHSIYQLLFHDYEGGDHRILE